MGHYWAGIQAGLLCIQIKSLLKKLTNRHQETVMEDRWLSVDDIAAYLGIKRDTVYKWIGDRNMPAHRVGRLWKFRKEEVDEWVVAGRVWRTICKR